MNGLPIHAALFDRHGVGWRAITLTVEEVLLGYTLMACAECIGGGAFSAPDIGRSLVRRAMGVT
jgi:hypothetical protein